MMFDTGGSFFKGTPPPSQIVGMALNVTQTELQMFEHTTDFFRPK